MLKQLIVLTATTILLCSCAQSPTGRNTIKLYSTSQLDQMGAQAFAQMKKEQPIATARVQNRMVQCVAQAITANVPKSVFAGDWEVVVFDDDAVNAFALPDGKIGVYRGLLTVAKNQHQLATVMGHEVGHVIAEHGNERMSSSALIGVGLELTNQLLKTKQIANNKQIMSAIGLGVQVGVQLPFSRTHESEADIIGLDLMAQAGFNPEQAISLWQNMDAANKGERPPELLSTHPSPHTRMANLKSRMAHAKRLYAQATSRPQCS